jgi:hypothetical protein
MSHSFDLGCYGRKVLARDMNAQRWFHRGLGWTFDSNYAEAVHCFQKAARAASLREVYGIHGKVVAGLTPGIPVFGATCTTGAVLLQAGGYALVTALRRSRSSGERGEAA